MQNVEPKPHYSKKLDAMVWLYRYKDPVTRKRNKVVIEQTKRREADREFDTFIQEREDIAAGRPSTSGWTTSFESLVKLFIEKNPFNTERQRKRVRNVLQKNELKLRVAADLNDTSRMTQLGKLIAAETSDHYARNCLQKYLKQLTRWSAAVRILPQNPLIDWRPLPWNGHEKEPQALTQKEFAALLIAADECAEIDAHPYSYSLVFKTLLVAGNRPGAMLDATIESLREKRIMLPPGVGKKKNGRATIHEDLEKELREQIKKRDADVKDQILCSPEGTRIKFMANLRRAFRRSMMLALTKLNWPADAPESIEPAEVAYLFTHDRLQGFSGPPPTCPKKIRDRKLRTQAVEDLAKRLRAKVVPRANELYPYHFRHTHQTWARIAGVNSASIDQQTGHRARDTGDRFYLDPKLVDASLSMHAVWKMLQEAISAVAENEAHQVPAALASGGENDVVPQEVLSQEPAPQTPMKRQEGRSQVVKDKGFKLERVKGFEPSTSTLARKEGRPESTASSPKPTAVLIGNFQNQSSADRSLPRSSDAQTGTLGGTFSSPPQKAATAESAEVPFPAQNYPDPAIVAPGPQKPPISPDLQGLIDRWPTLPEKRRRAILLMLED